MGMNPAQRSTAQICWHKKDTCVQHVLLIYGLLEYRKHIISIRPTFPFAFFFFFGAEYYSVNATHYRSSDTEPCCYDLRVSSRTLERNLYFELRMQARLFWNRTLQIAVRFSIVHVGDSKPMSTDSCISGHSPHLTIFSSSLIWDCKTRFSSRSLSFSPLARFIC